MAETPRSLEQLRAALAAGERHLPNLRLGDLDGVDLDLSDCNLQSSCFKEARFGHARLSRAQAGDAVFNKRCSAAPTSRAQGCKGPHSIER